MLCSSHGSTPSVPPVLLLVGAILVACGGSDSSANAPAGASSPAGSPPAGEMTTSASPAAEEPAAATDGAPVESAELLSSLRVERRWTWDDMYEHRAIRALVAPNKTTFFFDGGRQRGIAADAFAELEKHLNSTLDVGARKMNVVAIPVSRDQLIPYLVEGRGDIAVGAVTVTGEREEEVDFTVPTSKGVDELVVTGPGSPPLTSLDDLAGKTVHVRRSSSYWGSLEKLSASLEEKGLEPIELDPVDEYLETEDILEMVNAGLVPITVADSHITSFWDDVFSDIVVHEDLKVASGGHYAWAVRKDATGLKEVLDPWIEANREGTLLGNMLMKRYLKDNPWVKNNTAEQDRQRFRSMVEFFRKYGGEYELEPLLVAAQGYQESGLDQSKRSHVGAVGVMQVMPATANDPSVGIPNIDELEPNIQAGSKYLRHVIDTYFADEGIDETNRLLFAFAGYNAGPNRVNRLRQVAAGEGLDPNVWFRNVEVVVAREVGREPIQYVANIYKYYLAYRLMLERQAERAAG
jgi:membrane-bound lytic murein transglycosylase MltF